MYDSPVSTSWRVKNIDNGYISNWDGDWFYHFRLGGYNTIEWLEIKVNSEESINQIVDILRKIHIAGKVLKDSIMVFKI